jgi:hypothetical protein
LPISKNARRVIDSFLTSKGHPAASGLSDKQAAYLFDTNHPKGLDGIKGSGSCNLCGSNSHYSLAHL